MRFCFAIPVLAVILPAKASPVQPAPDELPQGRNAARVIGRSGVIRIACLSFFPPLCISFQYHTFIVTMFARIKALIPICVLLLTPVGSKSLSAQAGPLNDSIFSSLELMRQTVDSLEHPRVYVLNYYEKANRSRDSSEKILRWLNQAETMSLQLTDSFHILPIYAMYGRYFMEMGDYPRAVREFSKGLKLFGKKDPEFTKQEAWYGVGFGNMLYRLRFYPEARKYFQQSLKKFEDFEDWGGIAICYNNLGLCALRQNKPKAALGLFMTALKIRREKIKNPFLMAHSHLHLAQSYIALGDNERAAKMLNGADSLSLESSSFDFRKEVYTHWGELYLKINRYDKARAYLNKALQSNTGFNHDFNNIEIYQYLTELCRKTGKLDSALYFSQKGIELARKKNQRIQLREFTAEMVGLYREKGELNKAVEQLDKLIALHNQEFSQRQSVMGDLLISQQELVNQQNTISGLEAEQKNSEHLISHQRILIWSFSILAALALIGALVYFRINRKLRNTRGKLQDLGKRSILMANALDTSLISLDQRGNIIFINQAAVSHFEQFFQLSLKRNEAFLNRLNDVQEKGFWQKRLQRGEKSTESWQEMTQLQQKDQDFHFIYSFSPIRIGGTYTGMAVAITDYTDSYSQNIRLAQKSIELEKAVDTRDRMISLMAHDLKEGVFSSHQLTELAREDEEQISRQELMQYIIMLNHSLSKTKSLLVKTLDWIRAQNDRQADKPQFYIGKLVQDIVNNLKPAWEKKAIALTVEVPDTIRVAGDPEVCRMVLRNLINNAIKFSAPGSGKINIYSHDTDEEIEIHVMDNGVGIGPQVLQKILNNKTINSNLGTAGEKGTGMGLKLCQDLLNLNNSTLRVISEKGKGSDFYFRLPKARNTNSNKTKKAS